ncbi:MAG: sulfotransferase domain-containing protein, partial [archaeon]
IKFWWLDNRDYNDWEEEGKDITRLAALHWRHNIEEITKQAKILPKNRYLIIRYEEFTEDPMINFKKIIEFCGLDWNEQFRDVLKNTNFENRNFKWKENLTPSQKAILDDVLSDTLIQLGYK